MEDFISEECPSTWPREPDVKTKIESYREMMEILLEGQYAHPWRQDLPAVQSRVQILDLNEEEPNCRATQPDNPRTAWFQLEKAIEKSLLTTNSRHLILLEGMNPKVVEVIGVQLEIPPEFWFAHFQVDTQMRLFNNLMTKQDRSMYWKISIPQKFWLDSSQISPRQYAIYFGNCYRNWEWFGDEDVTDKTYAIASFWGKRMSGDSSISLVVVDAPQGYIFPRFHIPRGIINLTFEPVSPQEVAEKDEISLSLNPSGFDANRHYPLITPIWDLLVQGHKEGIVQRSKNPSFPISTIRNVVCSIWEAKVAKDLKKWNVIWMANDILNDSDGWVDDYESDTSSHMKEILQKSKRFSSSYRKMSFDRCYVQHRKEAVRAIMEAFGYDNFGSSSPSYRADISDDFERWKRIYDRYNWMDGAITSTLTMYAQYVTMAEAYTSKLQANEATEQTKAANTQAESANRLARSAGQLAKIATVAVPCTVAASILSMNGDFAAGERLFFVYWCLALPLTLGLLFWVIHRDVILFLRKVNSWI